MNQISYVQGNTGKVLISGGGGMIGRYLTSMLLERGYLVSHLSRGAPQFGRVRVFRWNPDEGFLDPAALQGVDFIIHLAGAGIGDKRWTTRRRKEIVDSRVRSAELIHRTVRDEGFKPKAFVSSSATGYYGAVTSDKYYKEEDTPGEDFLGETTRKWENAASLFENEGIRTVKIRSAVVLEKTDTAMVRITMPLKFGFLAMAGTGKQYMPWIHISDLCNIYIKAIEDDSLTGPYNAASSDHVTHREFMQTLASVLKKPLFPVPVPSFGIKILYGEMADVVLKGSRISSEKIRKTGYVFGFDNLKAALEQAYGISG